MNKEYELQSFTRFCNDYRGRFTHFAYSYVGDRMAAEDIVLESLMSYWEKRSAIHPESNISAYVLAIVKNKCLNYLNHQRVRQHAEAYLLKTEEWELDLHINSLEAFDPDQVFSKEIQQIVEDTLHKLPEQTRLIFVKSRYENYSHKQIAEEMNLSTKSVEFHITKALKVLRTALKDYFPAFLWPVLFN